MDEKQYEELLKNFFDIDFVKIKMPYDTGRSGAAVFAALFRLKQSSGPGFDLTYIVKIGKKRWADREEDFYKEPSTHALTPLLAPLRDISRSDQEKVAIAYDVAFESLQDWAPLSSILQKEEGLEAEQAVHHINNLSKMLVDWYINENAIVRSDTCAPHELLARMLGDFRMSDIRERLEKHLRDWDQHAHRIYFEDIRIFNPLPYLQSAAWNWTSYNPTFPIGRIHGDLHTGNILCNTANVEMLPKVIDFGQTTPNGVLFFDLVYLEFDILQNILSVKNIDDCNKWFTLLNYSMSDIVPEKALDKSIQWKVALAWKFIQPIRLEVRRLLEYVKQQQRLMGEYYEIAFWFTTIAVGLNFARKGEQEQRPQEERKAALLYAAYGLKQLLEKLNAPKTSPDISPVIVTWTGTNNRELQNLPVQHTATQEEPEQQYLQTLLKEEPDTIDLSTVENDTDLVDDSVEIPLTEAFVWPYASQVVPPYDTLQREEHFAFTGRQTHVQVQEQGPQRSETAILPPEELVEVIRKHSHLVILGDIGSGKTTLLHYLLLQIVHENAAFASRLPEIASLIPLFLELKAYASASAGNNAIPSLKTFLEGYLKEKYPGHDYASFLLKKAEEGKVLFLFDGLDDISDKGLRSNIVQQIKLFSQNQRYEKSRYIVTSRIIDYKEATLTGKYAVYTLADFTEKERESLIENWYRIYKRAINEPYKVSSFLERISSDMCIRCLASNPLLLTMLVRKQLQRGEFPIHRVGYLEHCISVLVDRWPRAKGHGNSLAKQVLYKELYALAFWMHAHSTASGLSETDLHEQLKRQFEEPRKADNTEKLAEDFLDYMRRKAGLLIETKADHYNFLFPPCKQLLAAKVLSTHAKRNNFIRENLYNPHWHEVIRLAVGLVLSTEDTDEAYALTFGPILPRSSSEKVSPFKLFFAGQCMIDNAGFHPELENLIMEKIVRYYLESPSDWARKAFSPIIRGWGDIPTARDAKNTLSRVLDGIDTNFDGVTWDKRVANSYQDLLEKNKQMEAKRLRLRIIALLHQLGVDVASWIEEAITSISDPTFAEVRQAAAAALGILGKDHPQVIEPLLKALSDPAWQVRSACANALGSLVNTHQKIISDLKNILFDASLPPSNVEAAITILGQVNHVQPEVLDSIITDLLNLFSTKEITYTDREPVITDAGQIDNGQSEVLPSNVSSLFLFTTAIKRNSILTVGQLARSQPEYIHSRSEVLEFLLNAISNADSSVRQAATVALGSLGRRHWLQERPQVVEALQVALSDSYLPVREAASQALKSLDNHILPSESLYI